MISKGKEMDKPSFCNDIEQAIFYEKYLQPEHSTIIKNIVDLRKKMSETVQAQALKYLLSDINWYWNEADLWK